MILKFNDGQELETTPDFNGHVVTIKDSNPNKSGFVVYNKGVAIFDATAYRTLYDQSEDMYMLSNDGSVKPEPPAPPVPPEPPKPETTEATLSTVDDTLEAELYDFYHASDVSFYISAEVDEKFLSKLVEIEFEDEVIDLTDGFKFQTCFPEEKYGEKLYFVIYHKLSEQEKVNNQVAQNTANIDYIAMETDIDLEEGM